MRLSKNGTSTTSKIGRVRFGRVPVVIAVLLSTLLVLQPGLIQAAFDFVGRAAVTPGSFPLVTTHLHEIQLDVVELEAFSNRGGAIEPLGDSLLVATTRGRIALIGKDGEVEYLPQKVPMNESASESPILWSGFRVADILLHERQPDRFTLYASHHFFSGDCVEFRISSATLQIDDKVPTFSSDWKTEFMVKPCIGRNFFDFGGRGGIQAGGRMLMDGPEHLLLVTGDHALFESYQEEHPQDPHPLTDPDSQLGKLLRIELASGEAEVIASGFRNPQGFARDLDGNLWQTEHGPQGGDELNLLRPDLDYGWPYVTHGIQYGNKIWPYSETQGRHEGFEKPVFSWIPAIGISNLIVSHSPDFPLWHDDLLIASLITRSLYRVRLDQGRVSYVEKIEIGSRIRDITQMSDGRIALLTDSANVLFLQRAPLYCQNENDDESIYSYDAENVCTDLDTIIADSDDPEIHSLDSGDFASPVIRSLFSIYIHNNRLTYVKSPCLSHDLSHRFFLHITPADAKDLARETEPFGFNVYDFYAHEENVSAASHEDGCFVSLALPDYDLKHINTGQVVRVESPGGEVSWEGPIWEGSHTFGESSVSEQEGEGSPYPQAEAVIPSQGADLFAARCGSCHNLDAEHNVGPHLAGVIGRRAGEVAGFSASDTLSALDIVWTQENLAEFIADPDQFAPGSSMAGVGVSEEEAQQIAEYLAANN